MVHKFQSFDVYFISNLCKIKNVLWYIYLQHLTAQWATAAEGVAVFAASY